MAPNKRADNKKLLSLWLDKELYDRFSETAEHFGVTMTSILTAYITEKVDQYELKRNNRIKRSNNGEASANRK